MKNIIYILIVFCNTIFAQQNKIQITDQISSGQLTELEFDNFKKFINYKNDGINTAKHFIVNYRQPVSDCFYDHYQGKDFDISWFEENIYEKLNLDSSILKLYYQNKKINSKKSNGKVGFDENNFLYTLFFNKNKLCHGLIVINENGFCKVFTGEYDDKTIKSFMKELKIIQKQ